MSYSLPRIVSDNSQNTQIITETIKSYDENADFVHAFSSKNEILVLIGEDKVDWVMNNENIQDKIAVVTKNFSSTPKCACFRSDDQVLMIMDHASNLSIVNTRTKKNITSVQYNKQIQHEEIFSCQHMVTKFVCSASNTGSCYFYDMASSEDFIQEFSFSQSEKKHPHCLFPIQQSTENVLFGVTHGSTCSIFDTRGSSVPVLSIDVGNGSSIVQKAISLDNNFTIAFAHGSELSKYDLRYAKQAQNDAIFESRITDLKLANKDGLGRLIVSFDDSLVKTLKDDNFEPIQTWKFKEPTKYIFPNNDCSKIFFLLESNTLVMKSNPKPNPTKLKYKLSQSMMRNVPGFKTENCMSRDLDTVINFEKLKGQSGPKESAIDKHLRQMNHTLALEACLKQKTNDHTLLPRLIEKLLHREVLKNVLSILDSSLLVKLLNSLDEMILNRKHIEMAIICVEIILELRMDEWDLIEQQITRIYGLLEKRQKFYQDAKELILKIDETL